MGKTALLSVVGVISISVALAGEVGAQATVEVNDGETLLVADLIAGSFQGTGFTLGPTTTFEINNGGWFGERGTGFYDNSFDFSGSTMNVNDGGIFGNCINPDCGIVSNLNLNVYDGGSVLPTLQTGGGTVTNFHGGTLDRAILESNSTFNLHGTGGSLGVSLFQARPGSKLNIMGGRFRNFDAPPGSEVRLIGGEFQLNGAAFNDPSVSLTSSDTFSGVLSDGNVFIVAPASNLSYSNIHLDTVPLPEITENNFIVDGTEASKPRYLRDGQSLSLLPGGEVDVLYAKRASVDIQGGVLGSYSRVVETHVEMSSGETGYRFEAYEGSAVDVTGGSLGGDNYARYGSVWKIFGGTHGAFFTAFDGSEVNIFGGSFDYGFTALPGSTVNVHGGNLSDILVYGGTMNLFVKSASVNGVPVDLELGVPVEISERGFSSSLEVELSDGSPLSMYLAPDQGKPPSAFVHPNADLFVILAIPEPHAVHIAVLCLAMACPICRYRRSGRK